MFRGLLNITTHRIHTLPIVVLMPHSSCNCRCIMCDIWKANHHKTELSAELLQEHIANFRKLRVREVVLSGGEALMHSNLWRFCKLLNDEGIRVTLLSTGLLLKRHAADVVTHINEVIVSLDGSESVHNAIRNVPAAFQKLSEGVAALRELSPGYRITGRCVLQRANFRDFENIVAAAKRIGLDRISFLPSDISTDAFNHNGPAADPGSVVLTSDEVVEFERLIEHSFDSMRKDFKTRFIAESPAKLRNIVRYYRAILGLDEFPEVVCNAPWVSAVIETDGRVMPCFFHKPFGNIHQNDLMAILNDPEAIRWRKNLDMKKDPICRKCVCTLKLGLRQLA